MSSRLVGRYNVHRLGWSAFEDLCVQIMRVVLGETCTRFLPGRDLGRDGWFRGVANGKLKTQNGLSGNFLIQCKHTSKAEHALDADDLKDEVAKIRVFAQSTPLHYVLMTNRRVSSTHEKGIVEVFEGIPNVRSCTVLSESWIEDSIDTEMRLLRLVPRLYGIGDLSQILSATVQAQTIAVLEDLTEPLRAFVPTDSYRRAEKALTEHRFVVLVGPAASGKSSIAANLCMVSIAQDPEVRVLRVETAEKFKDTWSPADKKTIYWVDDVFGETTLDADRLREWSAALEKVEAARKRGATIIFCTRDYILSEAASKLKRSKLEIINDARVRVEVTSLTSDERQRILYNHIKDGDISSERKRELKPFLREIAAWTSFSPELARRLGSQRFSNFVVKREPLKIFFDQPIEHFRDVIHGLSRPETAALVVCLFGNNNVPDPVPDSYIPNTVTTTYSVTKGEVKDALDRLEGSLVRRVHANGALYVRLHHPSMIDALQQELVMKSSQLELYLRSARLHALVRDTTMLPTKPNQRLVFLGSHLYPLVLQRFQREWEGNTSSLADFLASRATDAFLRLVQSECPEILDAAIAIEPKPESEDLALGVAVRLHALDESLLSGQRLEAFVAAIGNGFREHGCGAFFEEEQLLAAIPALQDLIHSDASKGFPSIAHRLAWYARDMASSDSVEYALEVLRGYVSEIRAACERVGLIDPEEEDPLIGAALTSTASRAEQWLQEKRDEALRQEDLRDDYEYERWKDERYEREVEESENPFADVDE